jgi:glutamyl-Q tRNA(Asp) synthetase
LERFGFEWDGLIRQRDRTETYRAALCALQDRGLTFECTCSRSQLEDEQRYPGTCRELAKAPAGDTATRLRAQPGFIHFSDAIQGAYRQDVAQAVGDLILKRRDQIFAYLLAVVVDDAAQGITDIVRGADLLDNTPRQIYLQRCLGLATPRYAHVPVLTEPDGQKLAKSRRSVRADSAAPLPQLLSVFSLLGMRPPEALHFAQLAEAWAWATTQWDKKAVPKRLNLRLAT